MSEITGARNLTLVDHAKATHDGKVLQLAEVLAEDNEIIEDMRFIECNDGSNHISSQRTGLPTIAWRELNKGIQPSKSTRTKNTDSTGIMEAFSDVDEDLYEMDGNGNNLRLTEDIAFTEALNQEMAEVLFYGDTNIDDKKFLGLTPRYSDPSAPCGENIIDGGGIGLLNSSLWLLGWGDNQISGLFPRGSKAGLQVNNKGKEKIIDDEGGEYYAYRTQFKWKPGLMVKNWQYGGRLCNVDMEKLGTDEGCDLVRKMIELSERVKKNGGVKMAWYCHPRIRTYLRLQMLAKNNVNLTFETIEGKVVAMFDGIPIRAVEKLSRKEAAVTGTFVG